MLFHPDKRPPESRRAANRAKMVLTRAKEQAENETRFRELDDSPFEEKDPSFLDERPF